MSLSNLVMTSEIQCTTFNQNNCVFKLPNNKVLLKNLRLNGVGLTTTGVSTNAPLSYAINVGVWQTIKNIYLYHNNQEISGLQDVNNWMAFKNMMFTNESNMDKSSLLNKSTWGFTFDNYNNNKIAVVEPNLQSTISSDNSVNQSSLLNLSEVLPFLEQNGSTYINTSVLNDLRLVVEFNQLNGVNLNYNPVEPDSLSIAGQCVVTFKTDALKLGFQVGNVISGFNFAGTGWTNLNVPTLAVTAVLNNTITINIDTSAYVGVPDTMGGFTINNFNNTTLVVKQPTLLVDELLNVNMKDFPFVPSIYKAIESQIVYVPAFDITISVTQNISQKLNAWNGKKLIRLMMMNKAEGSYPYGVKDYKSLGMYNEKWQFWCKGQQLLPNLGINTNALKQFYLNDAWNDYNTLNIPQGTSDSRDIMNGESLFSSSATNWLTDTNLCGGMNYGGIRVNDLIDGQLVSNFNMLYTREAFPNIPVGNNTTPLSNQNFTMILFGEVEKGINVINGEVLVIG